MAERANRGRPVHLMGPRSQAVCGPPLTRHRRWTADLGRVTCQHCVNATKQDPSPASRPRRQASVSAPLAREIARVLDGLEETAGEVRQLLQAAEESGVRPEVAQWADALRAELEVRRGFWAWVRKSLAADAADKSQEASHD